MTGAQISRAASLTSLKSFCCSATLNAGFRSRSSILRPRFSKAQLFAAPPERASCTLSRSRPALAANTNASLAPSRLMATRIWLHSFASCPCPDGPMCVTRLPIAWNTGSARSNGAASPPTMIVRVPAMAPASPPETGASSQEAPSDAARSASLRVTAGEIVDMSATISPGRAPLSTPSGPIATCSTSGESGTMVTTISDWAATSAGLAPARAPACRSSSTFARVRLCTVTSNPALRRFRAIGVPMMPSPTSPTRPIVVGMPRVVYSVSRRSAPGGRGFGRSGVPRAAPYIMCRANRGRRFQSIHHAGT